MYTGQIQNQISIFFFNLKDKVIYSDLSSLVKIKIIASSLRFFFSRSVKVLIYIVILPFALSSRFLYNPCEKLKKKDLETKSMVHHRLTISAHLENKHY